MTGDIQSSETPARGIILASSRGVRRRDSGESTPTPLVETSQGEAILDKQITAFSEADIGDIACVAGYHIEKLVDAYPQVDYYYDPDWQNRTNVASLAQHPDILSGSVVLATGGTLFEQEAVQRVRGVDADIAVAVTPFPSPESARDASRTLDTSELVGIDDGCLDLAPDGVPDARLQGLVSLSGNGADQFRSVLETAPTGESCGLAGLLSTVAERGTSIRAVDVGETTQRYDDQHALARFLLGTKAETLDRLDSIVEEPRVLNQETFTVATWEETPETVLDTIQSSFDERPVVVRSSAVTEDGWSDSQAGAFHTELGVDPTDEESLSETIEAVVDSLRRGSGQDHRDQILVQPQLRDVAMSGVAFTRELSSGGPYTVINYDDASGRTDTVTSGAGGTQRTAYLYHGSTDEADIDGNQSLSAVRAVIDELRTLFNDPPLDIEFAVDTAGNVTLLQVRPLAVHTGDDRFDMEDVTDEIESVARTVSQLQESRPLLLGDETVLGVMPDWNPAEMIGTTPDPLAVSLYRYLITDDVWAAARAESGYRDARPHPLMVTLAGRPYIDTLADFNSFLPASLPDELGRRLVEHYVDRLAANPEL